MSKPRSKKKKCEVCSKKIKTLIFQGTGVCSDDCRKKRDGDLRPTKLVAVFDDEGSQAVQRDSRSPNGTAMRTPRRSGW